MTEFACQIFINCHSFETDMTRKIKSLKKIQALEKLTEGMLVQMTLKTCAKMTLLARVHVTPFHDFYYGKPVQRVYYTLNIMRRQWDVAMNYPRTENSRYEFNCFTIKRVPESAAKGLTESYAFLGKHSTPTRKRPAYDVLDKLVL